MDFEEFHKQLAAAPLSFRSKLREYLWRPTERNACYITGYVAALFDAQLFKTNDAISYWLVLIGRTEGNGALASDLLAEMDAFGDDHAWASKGRTAMTDRKRIALELERTAMGDGYYGDALRAAKGFPEATPSVRALLDRWITGNQNGLSDRTDLCRFALQICMSESA